MTHKINPRRPFLDDTPDGLVESDKDFVNNNFEACIEFLEAALDARKGPKLTWTRVYETKSRSISHYLATSGYYNMTLRIWPLGGHITTRRFNLVIFRTRGGHILALTFHRLRDAKAWADDFFSQSGATIKAVQTVPLYT